jgi:hypothetical protein
VTRKVEAVVNPERRGDVKPELGRILGDNQNHTRP